MNKSRLESFSDGVFSIVMTLLIFDIKVPELVAPVTNASLSNAIVSVLPLLGVYFLSFAVLSTLWINHHYLFHSFIRSVDRRLNLLNLAYLMFVAFVPFSANVIGRYHSFQISALIYGLNIIVIVALSTAMMGYVKRHKELMNPTLPQRTINQARFRADLSLVSYLLGLIISFFDVHVCLFFFAFPIIFNITPGSLDLVERVFKFSLD
ncbi:MAG: hypothetical protein JWM46_180 [Candidatus Kaiserbacteria bacterium]|nr:hypothetical protein [Candidatus Kaiserbacteria bacterium]